MAGKWKEVVKLSFKGERFRDRALDLKALTELSQFQKMIAETAKSLWRAANPSRTNLPHHFEERVRLCLRRIEDGSATAPLEVFIEEGQQTTFWEPEPVEINKAIALAYEVLEALELDLPLPERFPRSLISEYAKWGQNLGVDEKIEMQVSEKKPVYLTSLHKERLGRFSEIPHKDFVDVSGEVFEADVKKGQFQIWSIDDTPIRVDFRHEQEENVTTALKEHKTVQMHIRGSGEYTPQGRLIRVIQVDELKLTTDERQYDKKARPIEEILNELAQKVPDEEWDSLPDDLNKNLDHYLYGVSKQ